MGKNFSSFALIGSLGALAISPPSAIAQDDEALIFEPASAWVMDRREDSCTLRRAFAAGGRSLTVQLRSQSLADQISISLASGDLETEETHVTYQFLPDEKPREPLSPKVGAFGGELQGVSFRGSMRTSVGDPQERAVVWPKAERQQREASITGLLVAGAFERPVLLQTGSMAAAMDAIRSCVDDLLLGWGFDPRINGAVAVPASPTGADRWLHRVMDASIPRARSTRVSNMAFTYLIGADGRVTQCRASNPGVDPDFAAAYCDAYKRHGRFEPARNASGDEVQSIATTWVTFG